MFCFKFSCPDFQIISVSDEKCWSWSQVPVEKLIATGRDCNRKCIIPTPKEYWISVSGLMRAWELKALLQALIFVDRSLTLLKIFLCQVVKTLLRVPAGFIIFIIIIIIIIIITATTMSSRQQLPPISPNQQKCI